MKAILGRPHGYNRSDPTAVPQRITLSLRRSVGLEALNTFNTSENTPSKRSP